MLYLLMIVKVLQKFVGYVKTKSKTKEKKEKTQEILSHFKGYKSAYIAEDLIKIIHFVCVSCTNV